MALQREDEAMALRPPVEAMVQRQVGEPGAMVLRLQVVAAAEAVRISKVC